MGEPALRSPAEVRAVLQRPFALEDIAGAPTPLLAGALDADGLDLDATDELRHLLASARAVTVAVASGPVDRRGADLAEGFDLVLAPEAAAWGWGVVEVTDPTAAIGELRRAVTANPASAVALVELLRMRAFDRVPQGLVLESLTYSMLQSGPELASWLARRGPAAVPADASPAVLVDRRPTSLHLTLNRPHRANAFSASMRDALVEALRVAAADPTVEGVVLDGAGSSFCSGGDLAEFGSTPDPATGHATRLQRSPAWWVHQLRRDIRVQLHGHCIGAGIEIPAFAGTVLAAPDTRIRLPEVAMGLVPGAGGTVSLPRRIGRQRTAWLAITGQEIDATQALSWGLVDRIVDR